MYWFKSFLPQESSASLSQEKESTTQDDPNDSKKTASFNDCCKVKMKNNSFDQNKTEALQESSEMKKYEDNDDNEFDLFGKSVALQLKKMPLIVSLNLQQEIQSLICKRRIESLKQSFNNECTSISSESSRKRSLLPKSYAMTSSESPPPSTQTIWHNEESVSSVYNESSISPCQVKTECESSLSNDENLTDQEWTSGLCSNFDY